ncbi:unnamed protein product [Rhodiola kirilowii]
MGTKGFEMIRGLPYYLGRNSVHGEVPSADYAKSRKKVLESEFGHVLGAHQSKTQSVSIFYRSGPFLALYRAAIISFHVLKLTIWQLFVRDVKKRSVKLGQALSTRPDILPTVYCQELAKLQDQIPPFPTNVAIESIESQLRAPISLIFADISAEPIAGSLSRTIYSSPALWRAGCCESAEARGMSHKLTLDALLFNMVGGQLKRFANARKDLLVAVNEMVRHMFDEIDYILEGQNAERFASLYGLYLRKSSAIFTTWLFVFTLFAYDVDKSSPNETSDAKTRRKKKNSVKVPKIYWKNTRKAVLTMEWVDGLKLTDEDKLGKAFLNRKELIDQGLYCSLRQLHEVGYFFHADPHPGNLIATKDGHLAYFDFGMMGDIPRHYRVGLIQIAIMNQLYNVMYEFDFTLPPDYAELIGRPKSRHEKDTEELVIHNDGSIRWNRLERLVCSSHIRTVYPSQLMKTLRLMLLEFILSEKGSRVRVFLLRDILKAIDAFLEDEVDAYDFDEKIESRDAHYSERQAMLRRVANGFRSLQQRLA